MSETQKIDYQKSINQIPLLNLKFNTILDSANTISKNEEDYFALAAWRATIWLFLKNQSVRQEISRLTGNGFFFC